VAARSCAQPPLGPLAKAVPVELLADLPVRNGGCGHACHQPQLWRGSTSWHWAEAAFLILALTGLLIVRSAGFHRRWLSYRVLAERLRSAYYLRANRGRLSPTGPPRGRLHRRPLRGLVAARLRGSLGPTAQGSGTGPAR
jgi:hypothetical protein